MQDYKRNQKRENGRKKTFKNGGRKKKKKNIQTGYKSVRVPVRKKEKKREKSSDMVKNW